MAQRALFIANRKASRVQVALAEAIACLEGHGFTLIEAYGDAPPRVDDIRRMLADVDLVIVAGGDGSINMIIGALSGQAKPLGIIPLGTANDLARTLALPHDVSGACAVIAAGQARRIDVSTVNGRYFCNVASVGFSVDIAHHLSGQAKRRWGVFAYAMAALRTLRHVRHFHAIIRSPEGEIRTRSVQIAVGNGRFYGGGMVVADDATIDDHHLHVYSLEVEHWWEMLALFPAIRRGAHVHWRRTRTLVTTELQLTTRRPRTIDIDGELATHTPAHFRLHPEALAVLCPPPFSAPPIV